MGPLMEPQGAQVGPRAPPWGAPLFSSFEGLTVAAARPLKACYTSTLVLLKAPYVRALFKLPKHIRDKLLLTVLQPLRLGQ